MKLEELIKTIQKVDLLSNTVSKQKLAGGNPSPFKGRGLVFDSIRKYEPGDDIRNINWKVTARFIDTYVNVYNEDKVRRIWLLVDVSGSSFLGTERRQKLDLEVEIAATLAYNAIRKSDSVGVIFFSDKIERLIMPVKGMSGFWHIARALVECKPCEGATSLDDPLNFLMKINCSSSLVFIISDFMTSGYERPCATFAQQNDVLTIRVHDKLEYMIPNLGWVKLKDIESGKEKWINSSSNDFNLIHQNNNFQDFEKYSMFLNKNGIRNIDLGTEEDIIEKLSFLMT